jgi:hypothetical protein
MTTPPRILLALAIAATTGSLAGCTTHYIPNTDVDDTSENREAVLYCEKYRKAVERRDVPQLMTMISPKYYEDGGNADASDDLDFAGMRDYLQKQLGTAKAIRYEIRYRRVGWSRESGRVFVDYTYSASYKVPGIEDKDEWRRTVSENRLELVKCAALEPELKTLHSCDNAQFKIIGGM